MKKILFFLAGTIFCISMISCVSTKTPVQEIPDTFQIVNEDTEKKNFNLKVEYPSFDAPEYEKLNLAIENCYKETFQDFKSVIEFDDGSDISRRFWYELTYDIYSFKDIKSVLLTCSTYTGGAHGNTQLFSYCYNSKTEAFLTAAEASGLSLQQLALQTRIKLSENKALYDYIADDWFMEGTAPTEENYNTFTLSDDGITIYFEPYKIAPYAAGIIQTLVPRK